MDTGLVREMALLNTIVPSQPNVTGPPAANAARNPASSHELTTAADIGLAVLMMIAGIQDRRLGTSRDFISILMQLWLQNKSKHTPNGPATVILKLLWSEV